MLFLQWNCRLLISLMRLKINRGPHCLLVPTKVFYVSNACHSCVTCFWPMQSLLTYLHRIFSFEKKRILSRMLIFSIKWRPIEFCFPAKLVDWFVFFCILWLLVYSLFTTSQKPQFDDSLLNLSALTIKHISWIIVNRAIFFKSFQFNLGFCKIADNGLFHHQQKSFWVWTTNSHAKPSQVPTIVWIIVDTKLHRLMHIVISIGWP